MAAGGLERGDGEACAEDEEPTRRAMRRLCPLAINSSAGSVCNCERRALEEKWLFAAGGACRPPGGCRASVEVGNDTIGAGEEGEGREAAKEQHSTAGCPHAGQCSLAAVPAVVDHTTNRFTSRGAPPTPPLPRTPNPREDRFFGAILRTLSSPDRGKHASLDCRDEPGHAPWGGMRPGAAEPPPPCRCGAKSAEQRVPCCRSPLQRAVQAIGRGLTHYHHLQLQAARGTCPCTGPRSWRRTDCWAPAPARVQALPAVAARPASRRARRDGVSGHSQVPL